MLANHKDRSENIKDTDKNSLKDSLSITVPYKKSDLLSDSYPKLNKLITALYIVTDIMENEEPIRLKLRTLGVEILSDINSTSRTELYKKTTSILSFLDIASTLNLISEMNFNILKKEFIELHKSFKGTTGSTHVNHAWLEDFLKPDQSFNEKDVKLPKATNHSRGSTSGHITENKTSTPAIKDWNASYMLKKQRREDIIKAIKDNGGSATIAEVKEKASPSLSTFSEKTLQRELVAMVKELILEKTGDKRWSKYVLKS